MNKIKIKCPAKINLDLKVFEANDGYHKINSTMQTINLYDFITIKINKGNEIILKGNSDEIPYDEKNICYKAAKLFLDEINEKRKVEIYIEKNIPVCAGLAGGSTDAAGVLYGLNKLFNCILSNEKIHSLASKLGSDLNFCLEGGTKLCTNRGEQLENKDFEEFNLTLIKPKKLKISAKEAYNAFDMLEEKSTFLNDLEYALIDKYEQLNYLHSLGCQMSGSGPTYFVKKKNIDFNIDKDDYIIIDNLKAIDYGITEESLQ